MNLAILTIFFALFAISAKEKLKYATTGLEYGTTGLEYGTTGQEYGTTGQE